MRPRGWRWAHTTGQPLTPGLTQPIKVYRGLGEHRLTPSEGDVITDPAFMSTSVHRSIAEGYSGRGDLLEITVPQHAKVMYLPKVGGENDKTGQARQGEALLPPNSQLHVTGVVEKDGRRVIQAEIRR
jgi:hypothetical protein